MKVSKLIIALVAATLGGSVFAADVPAANATATATAATATATAAAAQVAVAAKTLSVPAAKETGRTRAEVKAEAIEAAKNQRSTEASQYDWITR